MTVAVAMIVVMLLRPRGLWPTPEHGQAGRAIDPHAAPDSPQHNPPGADFPGDAVPRALETGERSADKVQDTVNP